MKPDTTIWTKDFILLCLANLIMAMAFYFLVPTLPLFIKNELHANKSMVGIILSAYTLAALIVRPFTGLSVDVFGRKMIYLFAFLFFALLFNVYVLATTITFLIVLRFIHGIGWGMTSTSSSTIIVDIIPPTSRGEGIGYYGLSMTIAMAIAPVIGLAISNDHRYNLLFISAGGLAITGFIISLFVKYPKYTPHPVENKFNLNKLIEPNSLLISLNMLILMFTYGGIITFITIYGKELGINNPGWFFILFAGGLAISRIFSGRIFDKIGPKKVGTIGILAMILGFPILAIIQTTGGFLISALIIGIGTGIIWPTFQAMANNMVPQNQRGAANSTFFTALDLGIGIGMVCMGLLSQKTSLSIAYLFCGVICFIGLLFFLIFVLPHYERKKLA